jgi:formylglycine-generating enzyme required for sulfatase activity
VKSPAKWSLALAALALAALGACAALAFPEERAAQATFRDCGDCPEMVAVPAGSYLMGSSPQEVRRDVNGVVPASDAGSAQWFITKQARETPQHPVTIGRAFAVGKFPVTRGEFEVFVNETGYAPVVGCVLYFDHTYPVVETASWREPGFEQSNRDPVVCVALQDIQAYIAWLNGKAAKRGEETAYRLPSEAEWEYAARGGTRSARWWGDAVGSGNANCDGCGSPWDKRRTSPAGSFPPNQFGLSDVLGNVWEVLRDCWHGSYDGAPGDGTAWTGGDCKDLVMRGGSWTTSPWVLRSAARGRNRLEERANYVGFRVAKDLR